MYVLATMIACSHEYLGSADASGAATRPPSPIVAAATAVTTNVLNRMSPSSVRGRLEAGTPRVHCAFPARTSTGACEYRPAGLQPRGGPASLDRRKGQT